MTVSNFLKNGISILFDNSLNLIAAATKQHLKFPRCRHTSFAFTCLYTHAHIK